MASFFTTREGAAKAGATKTPSADSRTATYAAPSPTLTGEASTESACSASHWRRAVVTEAASDPRVKAVVSDGLQGRSAADAGHLPFGDRIAIELPFAVAGAEIELTTGQAQPEPLLKLVHEVARTRPLLLIGTVGFEREFDRAYTRGTKAELWELPRSAHTHGLEDHPREYARRVLALFDRALL